MTRKREKLVEIHGAGFHNKGAQLMLTTAVTELRSRVPSLAAAIQPLYGSFSQRSSLGLYQFFPSRAHIGSKSFRRQLIAQRIMPSRVLLRLLEWASVSSVSPDYGMRSPYDSEALIDICGFAFSDQWGQKPIQDFAKLVRFYTQRGKPVIMLPQAFGPFETSATRQAIRQIVDQATVIFARDRTSYRHITSVCGERDNLQIAPDITLFAHDSQHVRDVQERGPVLIVPNARIMSHGKSAQRQSYLQTLGRISKRAMDNNLDVKIMVHDTSGEDIVLAKSLAEDLSVHKKVEIVTDNNAFHLAAIISTAHCVIGSRYHALVSALAHAVPVLAIGWSHKYETLLEDFGVGRFALGDLESSDANTSIFDELIDDHTNKQIRSKLQEVLSSLAVENHRMWDHVLEALSER